MLHPMGEHASFMIFVRQKAIPHLSTLTVTTFSTRGRLNEYCKHNLTVRFLEKKSNPTVQ